MVLQCNPREVCVNGFPRTHSVIEVFVPSMAFSAFDLHIESQRQGLEVKQANALRADEIGALPGFGDSFDGSRLLHFVEDDEWTRKRVNEVQMSCANIATVDI